MPEFVEVHSLDVGPLSNLNNGTLGINGFRGVFSQPLGYVIIRVQVEGVQGYIEDQVALVVSDSTVFGSWVPVTLGTPTINLIINMIKESKIDELPVSLNGLWIAQLLACQWAGILIQRETATNQRVDWTDLKEADKMTEGRDRLFFIQNKTWLNENPSPGKNLHAMTQSLKGGHGPHLPHSLLCGEHVHWSDFQEQASSSSSEKPDGHPNHYCQGH